MAEVETCCPGIDTFADLIDRLAVEVHKVAHCENRKRELHALPNKTDQDWLLIAALDNLSRDACEIRSMVKVRLNELLTEIVNSGEYKSLREVRTFRPPARRLSDILADRFHALADAAIRGEIAAAVEEEIFGV